MVFEGWLDVVPPFPGSIQYLEIGSNQGRNVASVAQNYGTHPESRLYCVDTWEDSVQSPNVIPIQGCSNLEVPKFQDSFFDMIYINGNHEPECVLEDAVLSFRKLKKGGYMIFGHYNFESSSHGNRGSNETTRGIEAFMSAYIKRIRVVTTQWDPSGLAQVFIQKI